MNIPKVKGALLHLWGFSIQKGTLHIVISEHFTEGMCDCYMWVSVQSSRVCFHKKIWYLKQGSLSLGLVQGSANYVHRPTSSLWSLLVHKLQMIFTFGRLKTPEKIMWQRL